MRLLVRKVRFPFSVEDTLAALFRIPQMQIFDEGWIYDYKMSPKGAKIGGYWSAPIILKKTPNSETDIYLVLTSLDIIGEDHRIHGMGSKRKAIATNDAYIGGCGREKIFDPYDVDFNAMVFGELGHALGLDHHELDPSNPCNMSHSDRPCVSWARLEDVRFCENCYQKIR